MSLISDLFSEKTVQERLSMPLPKTLRQQISGLNILLIVVEHMEELITMKYGYFLLRPI